MTIESTIEDLTSAIRALTAAITAQRYAEAKAIHVDPMIPDGCEAAPVADIPAPAKRGPGRPKKETEAPVTEAPVTEAPVTEAPVTEAAPSALDAQKASVANAEAQAEAMKAKIRLEFLKLVNVKGRPAMEAILKHFGVQNLSSLPVPAYAECWDMIQAEIGQ